MYCVASSQQPRWPSSVSRCDHATVLASNVTPPDCLTRCDVLLVLYMLYCTVSGHYFHKCADVGGIYHLFHLLELHASSAYLTCTSGHMSEDRVEEAGHSGKGFHSCTVGISSWQRS